ncbi:MAG: M28 family peptidase [Planctomycetota bacterium]
MLLPACGNPSNDKLREWSRRAEALPPPAVNAGHTGPGVAPGGTGTGRFARAVYENFRADRAMKTAAYADRYYREPGNEGFEAVLDRVRTELSDAGYGKDDWLRIEEFETLMNSPAWTPRRARIRLLVPGEPERVLHELARPEDQDRTMLPRNAPSGEAEGRVVLAFDDVGPGSVLVTDDPLSKSRIAEARDKGAVAVLSGHLREWNEDPSGKGRHLDAIAYASVPAGCALPVAMISPRSLATIREAVNRHPEVRIAFESEVELAERPLRTLVATIIGTVAPDETVVLPAHVQEPGACDNASGVATMLEGARVLAELVRSEELELPGRSIAFVWGDEMAQSRVWIERSGRVAVAAIAADMTGQSREKTGAMALLERMPDPGAVDVLPPDEHTPWGSEPVEAASLVPHGLSLVARCAMVDVAGVASKWPTREHPFEGGSDHVVFLEHGTPAVLFWHFTDFAYHTSLDRLEHVDPEEMRRTGSAILVTALAVADARPMDLERYLESLRIERDHRIAACAVKNRDATAELWRTWCNRVRLQLVDMCLNARAEKDTIGPEGDLLDPKERP